MDVIPRIRAARWADKEPVAAIVADALHSGPLAQWLVPDPTCRRRIRSYFGKDLGGNDTWITDFVNPTNFDAV